MVAQVLFALAAMSMRFPDVDTFRHIHWVPEFREAEELQIEQSTLALFTHCSRRFDPLGVTSAAVCETVRSMKSRGLPVLYLHDRYNTENPAWLYLYDDWQPTAYVGSDVGHIELDLSSVSHVVCAGGYFGQCERTTVTDVMRAWVEEESVRDFRITQVVDAVFTVAQHVRFTDSYSQNVRAYIRDELKARHRNAVIPVDQVLARIDAQQEKIEYLRRQWPALPDEVNVVVDFFEAIQVVQEAGPEAPTLTFAYRRSHGLR